MVAVRQWLGRAERGLPHPFVEAAIKVSHQTCNAELLDHSVNPNDSRAT